MDNAVSLVQAYLHVNGYFTVAEYPVLEVTRAGAHSTLTDVDILAFRFPGAGRLVPSPRHGQGDEEDRFTPDSALGGRATAPDMILGEVKEGRARLNPACRDPEVLRVVLERFGCCSGEDLLPVIRSLRRTGRARTRCGHLVRVVVFGATHGALNGDPFHHVSLGHVVDFLQDYLRHHWEAVRQVQFKDPAFGFLVTLEKALRAPRGTAQATPPPMGA